MLCKAKRHTSKGVRVYGTYNIIFGMFNYKKCMKLRNQYILSAFFFLVFVNNSITNKHFGKYAEPNWEWGYEFILKSDYTFLYKAKYRDMQNKSYEELSSGVYHLNKDTVILKYVSLDGELKKPLRLLWRKKKLYFSISEYTGKFYKDQFLVLKK